VFVCEIACMLYELTCGSFHYIQDVQKTARGQTLHDDRAHDHTHALAHSHAQEDKVDSHDGPHRHAATHEHLTLHERNRLMEGKGGVFFSWVLFVGQPRNLEIFFLVG